MNAERHAVVQFVLSVLEPDNPSVQFSRHYSSLGGHTLVFSNATTVDPQEFSDLIHSKFRGKTVLDLPEIKITVPPPPPPQDLDSIRHKSPLWCGFLLFVLCVWCLVLGLVLVLYVTGVLSVGLERSSPSPDAPLVLQLNGHNISLPFSF
jgi:hypothetical protein